MATLLTATAYAARRGVGKSAVSNWKKKGWIVFADDGAGNLLIDAERTDAKINANVDPTRGRPTSGQANGAETPPTPGPAQSLSQAVQDDVNKVRTDLVRAQTVGKHLENARRAGELVALAAYESRAADLGRRVRERMHGVVRKLAERLAAEKDPRIVAALLTEKIDEAFAAMADQAARPADDPEGEDADNIGDVGELDTEDYGPGDYGDEP